MLSKGDPPSKKKVVFLVKQYAAGPGILTSTLLKGVAPNTKFDPPTVTHFFPKTVAFFLYRSSIFTSVFKLISLNKFLNYTGDVLFEP